MKDLATTTVGAVVQPGTVLLNLVPVGDLLRAEIAISNEDIGSGDDDGSNEQKRMPGYKGIVRLTGQKLIGGMGEFAIGAGMHLSAEIIEGDRTAMEYLLSPVQKARSEAGREMTRINREDVIKARSRRPSLHWFWLMALS